MEETLGEGRPLDFRLVEKALRWGLKGYLIAVLLGCSLWAYGYFWGPIGYRASVLVLASSGMNVPKIYSILDSPAIKAAVNHKAHPAWKAKHRYTVGLNKSPKTSALVNPTADEGIAVTLIGESPQQALQGVQMALDLLKGWTAIRFEDYATLETQKIYSQLHRERASNLLQVRMSLAEEEAFTPQLSWWQRLKQKKVLKRLGLQEERAVISLGLVNSPEAVQMLRPQVSLETLPYDVPFDPVVVGREHRYPKEDLGLGLTVMTLLWVGIIALRYMYYQQSQGDSTWQTD